ncbi:HD domain-containing protein [Pedobacter panaciterrae]|jgi:Predicted HD superfamily hydrolase|uniref:HD domain-containing protein n=1 Tax=Pedobacter panaciterrae TaxID=363849 RepID=A0ABU8NTT7_9SPHI|nr:HD domain-containing protein [Pedobacter panaciterrae]NQX55025.1 HD domain-containing protein [Pedobacter panaciterrae]
MDPIIKKTIQFVKETLADAEAGHDWFHIERVYKTALTINAQEKGDELIVALAALLHDIADPKFNDGDEEIGPRIAGEFLESINVDPSIIEHVKQIIINLSYKASLGIVTFHSKELDIVQDADRLDAIGAIGIARAFTYGGYKNRVLYDPEIKPNLSMSKEEYKNSTGPTINHFYEKLFLLKDLMKTPAGKNIAQKRHNFMQEYLDQFYDEWAGMK